MKRPYNAKDRIIVALDVPGEAEALELAERLRGAVGLFKVGLELFTRCGPGIIPKLRAASEESAGIFLDLKFHDIPNTVAGAVRSAVSLGVDMLTIHLSGGSAMIEAAREAAGADTLLLGVSVLTSHSAETLHETGVEADLVHQVARLVGLGKARGLNGFVASPHEVGALRSAFGDSITLVVPGVRPAWGMSKDDQNRVMMPGQAIAAGADYLVIGRPITQHEDPALAAEWIGCEMAGTIL
ncbi:MAG: orotidine-5'-phosphate decarboxylase [Verrucomicrobia bacterium]|nr:orotidine-5'-phosphate decarboxylase [Verrucomicrobiota bacterium]